MFRIKQKNAPEGPCFACRLIRSFIMATVMLIILGLVASDKLYLLTFISTDLIAMIILVSGLILFLFKLWQWKTSVTKKNMWLFQFYLSRTNLTASSLIGENLLKENPVWKLTLTWNLLLKILWSPVQ